MSTAIKPTQEELKEKLQKLFVQANVKPKTKQASLVEFAFLQGFMFAAPENASPFLLILLMSGRSLLDE